MVPCFPRASGDGPFVETDGAQDDVLQELGFSEEELQAAQVLGLSDGIAS